MWENSKYLNGKNIKSKTTMKKKKKNTLVNTAKLIKASTKIDIIAFQSRALFSESTSRRNSLS